MKNFPAYATALTYPIMIAAVIQLKPFYATAHPAQILAAILESVLDPNLKDKLPTKDLRENLGPFVFAGCALLPDEEMDLSSIRFFARDHSIQGEISGLAIPAAWLSR